MGIAVDAARFCRMEEIMLSFMAFRGWLFEFKPPVTIHMEKVRASRFHASNISLPASEKLCVINNANETGDQTTGSNYANYVRDAVAIIT